MKNKKFYTVLAIIGAGMMSTPTLLDIFINHFSWIYNGMRTFGAFIFLIGGLMLARESGALSKALNFAIVGTGLAAMYKIQEFMPGLSANILIFTNFIPKTLLIIIQLVGLVLLCIKATTKIRIGAILILAARAISFFPIFLSQNSFSVKIEDSNNIGPAMITLCGWVLIFNTLYKQKVNQ